MTAVAEIKRTPLNAVHRSIGGRMVDFGGWDMPVQYPAGTVEEHLRTRRHAGLFDVSHMGEINVRGTDATALVNRLTSNDASKLIDGQAQYSALTTPAGTVIDDLLVYRFAADRLLLVVNAGQLWNKMLDAGDFGSDTGVLPCGLAARNTLRLEAGMALYGHEIDETTTLLEANLGWISKLNKGDFVGRDALAKQKEEGVKRRLVGFEMTERGIARDGQEVVVNGAPLGKVTSGSPAPYLKKNIGMAYVPIEFANEGRQIQIDVRGRLVSAGIVKVPFYKRER